MFNSKSKTWNNISSKKPNRSGAYLVCNYYEVVYIAYWIEDEWVTYDKGVEVKEQFITHWMQSPKPPQN